MDMRMRTISAAAYQAEDRRRVARNEEAMRVARIAARDEARENGQRRWTPDDEAAFAESWLPPEEEPEDVHFAGGNRIVLVTREKGDPAYTPEQMAKLVREHVGDFNERFDPAGMAGVMGAV